MFKNVASQKITFFSFDYSTGAPKTGDAANMTAYVSKDDGAVTVLGDTSAAELDSTNAKGLYSFDLTQDETNADKLVFSCKSSTANVSVVPQTIYSLPASFTSHVAQTGDSYARLGAPAGASVSADIADLPTNAELATALGTADDAVLAAIAALNNLSQANIRTAVGLASANLDTQLDALPTNAELATALGTADDAVLAAIAALNNLSQANIRTAVGLASANLDTQLADLPTNAELATALGTADDAVLAQVALVKAKTDQLIFTEAGVVDANVQYINDVEIVGDGSGTPFNV